MYVYCIGHAATLIQVTHTYSILYCTVYTYVYIFNMNVDLFRIGNDKNYLLPLRRGYEVLQRENKSQPIKSCPWRLLSSQHFPSQSKKVA